VEGVKKRAVTSVLLTRPPEEAPIAEEDEP
jgi:hypothetical protein